MAQRAAIVTGASSGIGLAIARMLSGEGYALTLAARRPERLEAAAAELGEAGGEVEVVPADVSQEEAIQAVVQSHRERFGRLDVLVNNAGAGLGGSIEGYPTKRVDVQLDVNMRAMILFYRECLEMLKAAGGEHRNALVVNMASISGKSGQPWLSIYSATKAGVIGFTQAMNKELSNDGIKSCAFCPGFVDTAMTDFIKEHVKAEEMIRPEDVAEGVRYLLRLSPWCVIPELILQRPGEAV
jgi:short-subunit dehydrogenase